MEKGKENKLDPLALGELLLDEEGGRDVGHVVDDADSERAHDVVALLDGHGRVELRLADDDKVGVGVTAVGEREVDGVERLQGLHLPELGAAHDGRNKSKRNNKGTHYRFGFNKKCVAKPTTNQKKKQQKKKDSKTEPNRTHLRETMLCF